MAPVALPSVDVSRPQLVVPRLALPVGHYCFVFMVSFGDTPLAQSIQANVTVVPERLVPIVEGGSYRVWSDTQDLVLDGSKSYDPNLEDGDQTPLSFHWACVASTQVRCTEGRRWPPSPSPNPSVVRAAEPSIGRGCPSCVLGHALL